MTLLKHITVSDFRSIHGTINVPLDAPVVLIHGQNGTGKTSLLSAIELGLTGKVPSLDFIDPRYAQHLVHKSSIVGMGHVSVEAVLSANQSNRTSIDITDHGINGSPLLHGEQARFYSERSFLAQSTLARLLEIYEHSDAAETDSQLTRFVKDLLGLDQLDALIDGLHDARDVRRIKSKSPTFREVRDEIPRLQDKLKIQSAEVQRLKEEWLKSQARLLERAEAASLKIDVNDLPALTYLSRSDASPEDPELRRLNAIRVAAISAREQWQSLDEAVTDAERSAAEFDAEIAVFGLNKWREGGGSEFERALVSVQQLARDLSPPESVNPRASHAAAQRLVQSEIERCSLTLARVAEVEGKIESVSHEIERARARVKVLDSQLAEHAGDVGSEAKMLNEVLPHVHSDNCPVCLRDFRESSPKPLNAFLIERINTLNQSASRMQALLRERAASSTAQADNERALATLTSGRLDSAARDSLKLREAALIDLGIQLRGLETTIVEGQDVTEAAGRAVRRVTELKTQSLRVTTIREDVTKLADSLAIDPVSPSETVDAALARIDAYVSTKSQALLDQQAARREAGNDARDIISLHAKLHGAEMERRALEGRIDGLRARRDSAEALMLDARELGKRARAVRTAIVRRVFNDDLNTIWRDLFVRLAPEENFVPRFALPTDDDAAVAAALETVFKAGDVGGNPRAMLSAGNLNTAALTLFLALHLSVSPTLPWLVLDDPVQSMDEVHIAQLAALFRTLSKDHKRQLIVAVHEKPLFDYLKLELSPAFESDKLITVELSRDASGLTRADFNSHVWRPDKAIAA